MSDHTWTEENLDAFVAGGLAGNERSRIEKHLDSCPACARVKTEIVEMEHLMDGIFTPVRPDAGLADRAIQKLRQARKPRPSWMRFVVAAAAVIVLGMIGGGVQMLVFDGSLPLPGMGGEDGKHALVSKRTFFGALTVREPDMEGFIGGTIAREKGVEGKEELTDVRGHGLARDMYKNQEAGYDDIKKELQEFTAKQQALQAGTPATRDINPAFFADKDKSNGKEKTGAGFFYAEDLTKATKLGDAKDSYKVLESVTAKSKEDVLKKQGEIVNGLDKLLKDEQGKVPDGTKMPVTPGTPGGLVPPGFGNGSSTTNPGSFSGGFNGGFGGGMMGMGGMHPPGGMGMAGMGGFGGMPGPGYYRDGVFGPKLTVPGGSPPPIPTGSPPPVAPPTMPLPSGKYFVPMNPPPIEVAKADPRDGGKGGEKDDGKVQGGQKGEPKPGGDQGKKEPPVQKEQPKPPAKVQPEKTGRKIIRTGEMEFEVQSFDKAVDSITVLITEVKGGFIATVNSDKLPNGKMRGSVVVRMPPEHLDKFLFDLRRELGKTGELKNQRIGSLDVTKKYTDIESRLRAARAIEERLIAIIKTGKGEIKDLVAAERELGLWRTKIEEMEGEIRYYGNQVALSTITISLYEKEILAPTAIVVSETVQVRIEADEVAKAHQAAMKSVVDLNGRITRSELKQHAAGQFQSIIHADIPPAGKQKFIDLVRKLGVVADFQEHQRQHTEGGSGRAPELKPKTSDVHFEITMHNTANIRPRLSTDLKVATTDVPSAYGKLLDAIARAKGQVRDGKLNEKDKLNIHAVLDFNVPASEKGTIDKLLESFGPMLERINSRAPVNDLSTESKFGYTLLLRDFASIPAKLTLAEIIATKDVPAAYAKLQAAIAKAKGQISAAQINEKDKLNIHATLAFTVPVEEQKAIEKLLEEIGTLLSRDKVEAAINQLSTTKKFGYSLVLRDFIGVPPRKSLDLAVASSDVRAAYAQVLEAVANAKGYIVDSKLNEQDKMNVSAGISFTVPAEEQKAMEKLLEDLGPTLSRNIVTTPVNVLATTQKFGFGLFIRDFVSIPPSKASDLQVATTDVPGSYAKLLEAINLAGGRIVDARLNEQDKFNISANIGFSVPTDEKETIDKLLDEIGVVLSRTNVLAPVNQLSLTQKFGYAITLKDFANILPSHAADIKLATREVPANYAKLVDAVVKAKGQISKAVLNENDRLNVSAELNFTIPTKDKATFDKMLDQMGTTLSRNNVQAPLNTLTTDRKFGYSLVLRDFAAIPPRETFHLQLAATDVSAAFRELQDAVGQAKGLVSVGLLTEDNKVKIKADFEFTLPAAERQNIEKLFAKVGAVLTRTSSQIAVNDLATDQKVGFKVTIRSTAAIPPRETVNIKLEVKDVDAQAAELREIIVGNKGRVLDSTIDRLENGKVSGVLTFEVPFASQNTIVRQIKDQRTVVSQHAKRDPQVPENELTTTHIVVTLAGVSPIVPSDEGLGSYVRTSLYMSFKIFSVCIMLIILGVSAVLPWALVIWIVYKIYVRFMGSRDLSDAATPPPSAGSSPA